MPYIAFLPFIPYVAGPFMVALGCIAVVMVARSARGRSDGARLDREALQSILDRLDRIEGRGGRDRALPDVRLERLEQAVDAVAIEVERIAEGQRFMTKVLAERSPDQPPADRSAQRGRVITPH